MGWSTTHWQSIDSNLEGFPYSINITSAPIESISMSNIKFCWDLSDIYTVPTGRTIIKGINTYNIKFWTKLRNFEFFNLPKSSMLLTDLIVPGACRGLTNLTKITVPSTIRYVDYYSFWGTGLTEIELPTECVYQYSSFPIGCVIRQKIKDCDGKLLLDCDGKQLYQEVIIGE